MIRKARWLKLRRSKLTNDPLCEECKERGKVTAAVEVHHIIPVERGLSYTEKARLMYDYKNLRSLCHNCHIEVHRAIGRGGTRRGAKNKNEVKLRNFVEKFLKGDPGG